MTEEIARIPDYRPADFALPAEAAELIREAVPDNTARAYQSRWRSFETWCEEQGRIPLPATAQTVAAYLTYLAVSKGLKAATASAHLNTIRAVHRASGQVPPDALSARKIISAAQRREATRDGRYGPRKSVPILTADLPAIAAVCDPHTPAGMRDRAVIFLGFTLLARRSEMAALNISDVEYVPGEGLEITIRTSKTDQKARGIVRRVHYAADREVCPVRAVLAWMEHLAGRGTAAGPLFTRIDRWGNLGTRLTPQSVSAIIAAACDRAGLPARGERRYSGHSVRRGGATSMLRNGADPLNVSRHGRWTDGSAEFAGYVEEATGFGDGNPTKGLL